MTRQLCVVLNNQFDEQIDEFVDRCKRSSSTRVVFQPYTPQHLRQVYELAAASKTPVPLYLVVGKYGTHVVARALLRAVEYREDLSPSEIGRVGELISANDSGVYAQNLLFASDVQRVKPTRPLKQFRKAKDGTPLLPGQWPAVVCYAPSTAGVNAPEPDGDEALAGVEGRKRLRLVVHRSREAKLRSAKVAQAFKMRGRLQCEVGSCGFDFLQYYGEIGRDYAQVHHLKPLGWSVGLQKVKLADLAIVCANCHAMIHRGGECRTLEDLDRAIRQARNAIDAA